MTAGMTGVMSARAAGMTGVQKSAAVEAAAEVPIFAVLMCVVQKSAAGERELKEIEVVVLIGCSEAVGVMSVDDVAGWAASVPGEGRLFFREPPNRAKVNETAPPVQCKHFTAKRTRGTESSMSNLPTSCVPKESFWEGLGRSGSTFCEFSDNGGQGVGSASRHLRGGTEGVG